MSEHHQLGRPQGSVLHDRRLRHRAELAVNKADVVTVIDKWPTDRQQAKWREMVVGDTAADRPVRNVDEKNTHLGYLYGQATRVERT